MASIIFTKPVQRQIWLLRDFVISSREGSGFRSIRCFARTTIPGMQNPHWTPPVSVNDLAKMSLSFSVSPSSVMTFLPFAFFAGTAQDATALPSTMTVQQPHDPCGAHPSFGDVSPACSRRTVISEVSSSISAENTPPLRINSSFDLCSVSVWLIRLSGYDRWASIFTKFTRLVFDTPFSRTDMAW